jgi:hypothetical protein
LKAETSRRRKTRSQKCSHDREFRPSRWPVFAVAKTARILVLLAALFPACGGQKELRGSAREIVGTVYVIGNEPFTDLSVQMADRSVRIVQRDTTALYRSLWKMQGKKVRIQFRPTDIVSDSTHFILEQFEIVRD